MATRPIQCSAPERTEVAGIFTFASSEAQLVAHTHTDTQRERNRQPKDSRGELGVNNAQADCVPLLRQQLRGASLQRDKANYFCSVKNKTRFDTLYHSVRRQSINKQYNYGLISRQTTTMRVCVCVGVCTRVCVCASSHATRLSIIAEIRGNG